MEYNIEPFPHTTFTWDEMDIPRFVFRGLEELNWWKDHELQKWLSGLYDEKGGQGGFYCHVMKVTREDSERLEVWAVERIEELEGEKQKYQRKSGEEYGAGKRSKTKKAWSRKKEEKQMAMESVYNPEESDRLIGNYRSILAVLEPSRQFLINGSILLFSSC
jgi:hypothetical protein